MQPNFFKRAWLRMSGRRTRGGRFRTRSDPARNRRRQPRERGPENENGDHPTQAVTRHLSAGRMDLDGTTQPSGNENLPDSPTGYENLPHKTTGYENLPGKTPEGYEVMTGGEQATTPDGYEVMSPVKGSLSMQRFFAAKRLSQERKKTVGESENEDNTGEEVREKGKEMRDEAKVCSLHEKEAGSVSVDAKCSPMKAEITAESCLVETRARTDESSVDTENDISAKTNLTEATGCDVKNLDEEKKLNEQTKAPVANDESSSRSSKNKEKKGEGDAEGGARMNGVDKSSGSGKNQQERSPLQEEAISNGVLPTIKTEECKDTGRKTKSENDAAPVSRRRGIKNPPPELALPISAMDDDLSGHPYVNSPPKTADYVNIQANQLSRNKLNPIARLRSETGVPSNATGGKSKPNPYTMYDSNEDSIYHSVESLMPSSYPGYQNITYDPSRCRSYENISGHSYANVEGSPSYQNITRLTVDRSYVNLPSRKSGGNLNYIQVAGVESGGAPSPLIFDSRTAPKATKQSSDYTWIDEEKTRQWIKTAQMHSDSRKENLRRNVPKK